jgi:hypothetical protein
VKWCHNFELDSIASTSYKVNSKPSWITKRNKNECPIIYVPVHEIILPSYYERDEGKINEAKTMFHAGEFLEPIKINLRKEILNHQHLAIFAYEIGLSHVPVIVIGEYKAKLELESQYKEKVKKIKREEKPMVKQVVNQKPQAYGTFIKKGNRLYRTEAYIEWGNSEGIIGTVIMLNPGSAKLQIDELHDETPVHNKLTIDPTMESLIQIIEDLYSGAEQIKGRLYIYNLFPLQNAKSSNAVTEFEKLWLENESIVKTLPKSKDEIVRQINHSPWVLLGWGCGHRSPYLDGLKSQWLDIISETKTPLLGKVGKSKMDYYHPRPQLQSKQIEYRDELKQQFKQIMRQEAKQLFKGIQDISWQRHLKYYQPIEEIKMDPYRFLLFDIQEQGFSIDYNFRLLCFIEGFDEPILALNHESSRASTSFFGATIKKGHLNLGIAPQSMTIVEFRKWALKNIPQFIEGIDTKALYKKIKQELQIKTVDTSKGQSYDELMKRRIEQLAKQMREFQDRFEYCFIQAYEEEYEGFDIHAIPMDNVNIVLIEVNSELKLAGVEFEKSHFTIEQVVTWLKQMNVFIGSKKNTSHVIEDGHQILGAFKFTGHVLALYRKGKEILEINPDKLIEITEKFGLEYQNVDTQKSKGLKHGLTILLNNKIMPEVPRLEFDRKNDMVISNGNLLKIDYIDAYEDGIGFFRFDESEPIAVILDRQTTVKIDVYEMEDRNQICNVEHKYIINFDVVE